VKSATTEETRELAHDAGDDPDGGLKNDGALIIGRFNARARVNEGEQVEVAVDTSTLHFFDPDTALGIYEQQPKGEATT